LGDGGSIASLYVDPDYGRLGIATRLLDLLIREALRRGEARLHAAASRVSLPVFRQAGFEIESEETVERRGIPIERFLVAREGAPGR
jgi:putative acetyltransferase